ncbi:MAG TPA: TlpA disulfide reductase family protein [Pyrinomonadaceae bacterium]|nr:TlpA disulfide reductase family protein [Pyrinomonadaceae bacterium]
MIILAPRQLISFALSLLVLLSGFSVSAQSKGKGTRKPRVASAHSVAVKEIDFEGLKAALKPDAARPLLVNFWATWCDPCREEFPDLVKIDADFRGKGLDFITVSLDDMSEIKTEVPKFLRGMQAKMPAYLLNVPDPEPAIKFVDPQWGGALPATVLYNAKGEIVFKHFGRVNADDLRAAILKEVGTQK